MRPVTELRSGASVARPEERQRALATAEDLEHRLALWLAEVSAEAAAGPHVPRPTPTQLPAASPRVGERPR